MSRLRRALGNRGGFTLVELMAASTLLIILITLCAAAVPPAARIMSRLQTLNHAQVIADDVLETVRSELEGAQRYVKFYENGDDIFGRFDFNWGSRSEGEAVEFLGENGYVVLLSAEGCEETDLCRRTTEGYELINTEDPVNPGRLLLRYYLPEENGRYTYSRGDKPVARALTTVYPDAFYMKLWLKLEFKSDGEGSWWDWSLNTKYVTVTASVYRDEARTDLVCSDSRIVDLRFAGSDGLKIQQSRTAQKG